MRYLALLWLCSAAPAAAAPPARVVSINLCADTLLLELLPRERLVSLSRYAAEPSMSPRAAEATGIPANDGHVEEIVELRPDLVLAGRFNSPDTVALMQRLRLPVMVLEVPDSLAETRAQVRAVAAAVGAEARGETLVADMQRRLQRAAADLGDTRPLAAVYRANGYTAGTGTLVDELLDAAGIDNLAARLGIRGWGRLDLESLLLGEPDLLVLDLSESHPSLARQVLEHDALHALMQRVQVVQIPARLWTCAGPWMAEAVERLAAARRRLQAP